ncbi:unnamed protein product, partial [Phaeothamnion confervicola]
TGEIPKELGQLVKLERLKLSWNKLTGEIPKQLGGLTKLTALSLGSNQLTEQFYQSPFTPPFGGMLHEIAPLPLLISVEAGKIPKELGQLARLKQLWLNGNQLTAGTIPKELGSLENLTILSLSYNELIG